MRILKINPKKPELKKIRNACRIMESGGLVVFPTETVYGLGADMYNEDAVRKIYRIKNRPHEIPLIVHIADTKNVETIAKDIPGTAPVLMNKFWPGPLTLVLKKKRSVSHIVTAGSQTVGVRMPSHPVALALLEEFGKPVVAPSANKYGKISPTTAGHVESDIGDLVLDAGKTFFGLESTVIDLTTSPPCILRSGSIIREDIEKVIGRVETKRSSASAGPALRDFAELNKPKPSGRYAPDTRLFVLKEFKKIIDRANRFYDKGKKVGIVVCKNNLTKLKKINGKFSVRSYGRKNDYNTIANMLYSCLHSLNEDKVDVIIIEAVKEQKLGSAIMDRLNKR
jgi:L-threonylcarbamoyladenylate synthase